MRKQLLQKFDQTTGELIRLLSVLSEDNSTKLLLDSRKVVSSLNEYDGKLKNKEDYDKVKQKIYSNTTKRKK